MNSKTLDHYTNTAIGPYRTFLLSMSNTYGAIYNTSHATSAVTTSALKRQLVAATNDFNSTIGTVLSALVEQLVKNAIENASSEAASNKALREEIEVELHGRINETMATLLTQLNSASHADMNAVLKHHSDFRMRVDAVVHAKNVSLGVAIARVRMEMPSNVQFAQLDRSGRRWDSMRYVHTSVRMFLLRAYVESFLYVLVRQGIDVAEVAHEDENHENHGKRFSISGESSELPSYYDIRDVVFHPNSRATVVRVPA